MTYEYEGYYEKLMEEEIPAIMEKVEKLKKEMEERKAKVYPSILISQAALGTSRFYMRLMTGIKNLCMFLQKRTTTCICLFR